MGLILDLAVVALAVAVVGSLALLAWTLAVSGVRATDVRRHEVAAMRRRVIETEERLRLTRARAEAALERLAEGTAGAMGEQRDR